MSDLNQNSNFYTTGEIARLCGVTVRTVQYYDSRNLLVPSELSEGGRRMYSEGDLQRLKIICFLREINLSIDTIGQLLAEEHPESVISILLDEQEKVLAEEINERQKKQSTVRTLQNELKNIEHFTVESIGDIAHIMQNRANLRHVHTIMFVVGILMDIIEVTTFAYSVYSKNWWIFGIGMVIAILMGVWISAYYFKNTAYICPQCHTVFRPKFREALLAPHTPRTRRLHCTKCNYHGFCVETYRQEDTKC